MLYPSELLAHMKFLVPLADEVRTLRRRTLYPAELRGLMKFYNWTRTSNRPPGASEWGALFYT